MKFWQILSVLRDEKTNLIDELSKPQWKEFFDYYQNIEEIIKNRNRGVLDKEFPSELGRNLFSKSNKKIYISTTEKKARNYKSSDPNIEIPILRGYEHLSGDAMDEIFEKSETDLDDVTYQNLIH